MAPQPCSSQLVTSGCRRHGCLLFLRSRACTTGLQSRRQGQRRCNPLRAVASDLHPQPDLGARDPFDAEVASNFTDKTLGSADTMHLIRGPPGMKNLVGLATKRCIPCEGKDAAALDMSGADKLRGQTPGWRIVEGTSSLSLRQDWKVINFRAGLELIGRIAAVAEAEGHHPDLHLEGWNNVHAELSTHSVGGLTENDFILAAKINAIIISDLLPKKKARFWA